MNSLHFKDPVELTIPHRNNLAAKAALQTIPHRNNLAAKAALQAGCFTLFGCALFLTRLFFYLLLKPSALVAMVELSVLTLLPNPLMRPKHPQICRFLPIAVEFVLPMRLLVILYVFSYNNKSAPYALTSLSHRLCILRLRPLGSYEKCGSSNEKSRFVTMFIIISYLV
jgi:hypothetical protein